jgi:SHAQKYF class myb-like DNA-binding protein
MMNSFGTISPTQPQSPTTPQSSSSSSQNQSKARKPYIITKQRENWTEEEHQKFLEALALYDRDWKKIEAFVGSKTVIQIRSHAQKYFLKVQKNNTGERIPPPRPKRKSIQPYPQKTKQDSITIPWVTTPDTLAVNPFLNNPAAFAHWMAANGLMPGMMPGNNNAPLSPIQAAEIQRQQQEQLQQAQHFLQQAMSAAQQNQRGSSQGRPNFSKIYVFLGSLFDPNATNNYVEALNDMSPIDRETVQLLMHNLAANLANQQFRDQHSLLLDQYRALLSRTPTEPASQLQQQQTDSITMTTGTPNGSPHLKSQDEQGRLTPPPLADTNNPAFLNLNAPTTPIPPLPVPTSASTPLTPPNTTTSDKEDT